MKRRRLFIEFNPDFHQYIHSEKIMLDTVGVYDSEPMDDFEDFFPS